MQCEWKTKEIVNWTAQQFSNMQSMQWYIASTMWNPHIVKLGLPPNSGEVVFLQIYISCLLLPLSVCLASCWTIASRKFPSHDDVKRWCGCRRWCVNLQSCKMKSTDTILNRTNSTDYLKEPKKNEFETVKWSRFLSDINMNNIIGSFMKTGLPMFVPGLLLQR